MNTTLNPNVYKNQIIDIQKRKYNKEFTKVINRITVLAVVLTFLLIFAPVFTDVYIHAERPGEGDRYGMDMDGDGAVSENNNRALPLVFVDGILDNVLKPTVEILTGKEGSEFGAIHKAIMELDLNSSFSNAHTVLKTIAAFWVLITATTHMIQSIGQGQNATECVYKFFIEFSVTAMFIIQAENIMTALTQLGQLIASAFGEEALNYTANVTSEEILTTITGKDDGGVFWFVQAICAFFIPWIVSVFAGCIAKLAAIQILLEIAIRKMFAPLAVADIYKEGLRSPGVRYMKKYFACILRLSVCVFICLMIADSISSMFNTTLESGASIGQCFDYLFGLLTVEISAGLLMFKAGEFANDAVGV